MSTNFSFPIWAKSFIRLRPVSDAPHRQDVRDANLRIYNMTVQNFVFSRRRRTVRPARRPRGVSAGPLRRFEHDFAAIAGPTPFDPARGILRAGSWVGLRRKIARKPFGAGRKTPGPSPRCPRATSFGCGSAALWKSLAYIEIPERERPREREGLWVLRCGFRGDGWMQEFQGGQPRRPER
jgi:hypothetical protein